MKITNTTIPDVWVLEPTVHGDERGYLMETFRNSHFELNGLNFSFVQDNESYSSYGTLRGLHYQLKFPQGKIARVISGEVYDVAVDFRVGSPTFRKWVGVNLSGENKRQLWIPPGFAHGFVVLSKTALFSYKCTEYYHPEDEYSVCWDDKSIGIQWPVLDCQPVLSERDRNAISLANAPLFP